MYFRLRLVLSPPNVWADRPVDIYALTVCKWRFSALPVLMYLKVHSAPVLEKAPFSPRHCKNLNRSMHCANKKPRRSGVFF
ncbi:hypothetical protein F9K97_06610 [Brucella anthropi]|uniref:Uncharacterized protein n=1 Tax=Brucella anthropi TaxID=529 RepID=A0A6I0DR39_BRUAN|nr:hypothetical protein F9K89_10000 [Brucella anthropi]MCR5941691.1 hypothetical protein [Ochrobactrum sp. XJ1]KAB2760070.1 hypothetical protein F9K81_01010 [Brucella anthropi]KAB2771287.1 hypothetical protein F9K84_00890 [Brucella anthropi]KAB2787609.1 hypothetical protein F9K97_06610 [Brucella anthropi]